MKVAVGPVAVEMDDRDRICWHIKQGNGFEPQSLLAWSQIANHGTVIDIGAYTGLFSIAAVMLGAVSVLAIEPLPNNLDLLYANMRANGVEFEVIVGAASDHVGEAVLNYNPKVNYTTGGSLNPMKEWYSKLPTDVITIDSLNLEHVSAIKIDVEGHEDKVIAGAMHTILRDKPKILVEVLTPEARARVEALLSGYIVAEVLDRRNVLMLPTEGD